jgi:DNA polymerase delta subunit 2
MDTAYHSSYDGISYLGIPYEKEDFEDPLTSYCGENDLILLEDESGRVELMVNSGVKNNNFVKEDLATGVVIAAQGTVGATGVMKVDKILFPAMGPQDEEMEDNDEEANILLISGLDCGGSDRSTSFKREILIDFLTGHFDQDQARKIARVIVAGGGCTKPIKPESASFGNWNDSSSASTKKEQQQKDMENSTLPIRELDLFLGELCASGVPVDYIPGLFDPTNANWPQKPLHPCLVPHADSFVNMLCRSTNPYDCKIGGKVFMGSDGYNFADLKRFLSNKFVEGEEDDVDDEGNPVEPKIELRPKSSLEVLESSLIFNHMCPTGPDSLPMCPFEKEDPFVIQTTPHVYFAGNCNEFETKLLVKDDKTTRLICVPSFEKTGQAVLLNLKSLDCTVVEFGDAPVGSGGEDEKKMQD